MLKHLPTHGDAESSSTIGVVQSEQRLGDVRESGMETLRRDIPRKRFAGGVWWRRGSIVVVAVLSILAGRAFPQASPPPFHGSYTITDLGVLPNLNDTDSRATAINANGTVVGFSYVYNPDPTTIILPDAFVWVPQAKYGSTGTLSYLGGLTGTNCYVPPSIDPLTGLLRPGSYLRMATTANDINSTGQIVGESSAFTKTDNYCATTAEHGILYQNGQKIDLGVPPGSAASEPVSINDSGQMVGVSPGGLSWFYDGSYHNFGTAGYPTKINNSGTFVGALPVAATANTGPGSQGFVHTGPPPILSSDIFGNLGGLTTVPYDINDAGMIVGTSALPPTPTALPTHAFLIDKQGHMSDLGTASSDPGANSQANAINNSSFNIVGNSDVDPGNAWQATQHAVLWQNAGKLIDLNTLLDDGVSIPPAGTAVCPNQVCWELLTATAINDLGQIVGEGIMVGNAQAVGQRHAYLLSPPCANEGGDTDGDGLCDNWETNGYTAPDGTFVDLPHMGANPMHKDIFVQADYMVSGSGVCGPNGCAGFGHTHKPKPNAMALVTEAFANAPVSNPDGKTGITLHVDCGPDCIMNPSNGAQWGSLSRAQSLPEVPVIGGPQIVGNCVANGQCDYDWTDFSNIAATNFLPTGRDKIFHYAIFGHDIGIYTPGGIDLTHNSGVSEGIPTNNFIVSLGAFTGQVGSVAEQGATFMHELGHNLGLGHGGKDDVNYKPNYLSIMNYSFTLGGLFENGAAGAFDFSKFSTIPYLNENALDNAVGLNGGPAIANYGTTYYCALGGTTGDINIDFLRVDLPLGVNGPIDWGCTGAPSANNVVADINGGEDVNNHAAIDPNPLTTSEDWSRLIFTGGGIGGLGAGLTGGKARHNPRELPAHPDPVTPYRVEMISPGIIKVLPGSSLNLTFTINNSGTQTDTYDLAPFSVSPWWIPGAIPNSVTLTSHTSQQIVVPVNVSTGVGCTVQGETEEFRLDAVSRTHPAIQDSAIAILTSTLPAGQVPIPDVVGTTQPQAQAALVNAGLTLGTVTTQFENTIPAGIVVSQSPSYCTDVATGTAISLVVSLGPNYVAVPNIVGATQSSANFAIKSVGLTVGVATPQISATVPAFNVISQDPPAGKQALPGSAVNYDFSEGAQPLVQVPDLTASPFTSIIAGGLTVGTITPVLSPTVPKFNLISQDPLPGTLVPPGTPVNVTFSTGNQLVAVPNVVGQTQSVALSNVFFDNFAVTITRQPSTSVQEGVVISQTPLAGTPALLTTPMNLVISSGAAVTATVPNFLTGPLDLVRPSPLSEGVLAENAILAAGFVVGSVTTQLNPVSYDQGVVAQSPAGGSLAPWNSAVNLVLRTGTLPVQIPNVVGMTEAAAVTAFNGATPFTGDTLDYAFTTQSSSTVLPGNIISQDPPAGFTQMPMFYLDTDPVNIVISSGPVEVPKYQYLRQFGHAGQGRGQISTLTALAIDPATRDVLVGDSIGRVQIFDANGGYKSYFGGVGLNPNFNPLVIGGTSGLGLTFLDFFPGDRTGDGLFSGRADSIAIDPVNHNLVIVDVVASRVMIFSSSGQFIKVFGTSGSGPGQFIYNVSSKAGVAIDPASEDIYVTDAFNKRVQIFDSTGTYLGQIDTSLGGSQPFAQPVSIAIDPVTHNILVGDGAYSYIQIYDSTGVFQSKFGSFGGGDGQFYTPVGIAVDPMSRNIVVTDIGALGGGTNRPICRVQILDSNGNFLSKFGGPGSGNGQFNGITNGGPAAVAIDPLTHNILAGDSSRVEVFGAPLGTSTTLLTTSDDPITVGEPVTFTATVVSNSATGAVQFMDGPNALLGPVSLTDGVATFTTSTLSVGSHSITAVYSGDATNGTSTSAVLTEVVNLAGRTTTLVSSLNPATVGQAVTFIATVSGNGPTGTVQFVDGASNLGAPVTLTNATASVTSSALLSGTHPITAVYSGDSSNAASTSAILFELVSVTATGGPVVTPPASIVVPATEAGGARGSAWPALGLYLISGTAVSTLPSSPVRLPARIGGTVVDNSTLFPVGVTTVSFSFKDANGNIGTASSTVTVTTGTPRITGSVASVGTDPSGAIYVNVVLTNTGTGNARNLKINTLTFRTLSGTGAVTYNAALSPTLPLTIGKLDLGSPVTTRVYLNVPSTAARISITESGPVQNVSGTNYNYSTAESLVP